MGGGRYSDNRYSDISKWVMQWARVRVRVSLSVMVRVRVWARLGYGLGLVLVLPFQKHFIGIAAVGIAACTRSTYAYCQIAKFIMCSLT